MTRWTLCLPHGGGQEVEPAPGAGFVICFVDGVGNVQHRRVYGADFAAGGYIALVRPLTMLQLRLDFLTGTKLHFPKATFVLSGERDVDGHPIARQVIDGTMTTAPRRRR